MDSLVCSLNRAQTTIPTTTTTTATTTSSRTITRCKYDYEPNNIIHVCKCPTTTTATTNLKTTKICNTATTTTVDCDNCIDKQQHEQQSMGLSGNRKNRKCVQKFGLRYTTQLFIIILVAYIITWCESAPIHSAAHHQVRHRRDSGHKFGCHSTMTENGTHEFQTAEMRNIINIIAYECTTALQNAKNHAPKYISLRWKDKQNATDPSVVENTHKTWEREDGSWLHPERIQKFHYEKDIPSELKNKIVQQLANLDRTDSQKLLIDMYDRFMRIRNGVKLIIKDHEDSKTYNDVDNYELSHIYTKLENDIEVILCEIKEGIILLQLKPEDPEQYEPESYRDKTVVRDWVIYREYMSLLKFISDVYNQNHE